MSGYLLGFAIYTAIVGAALAVWWLKCHIQDRLHARQTVAKWDQITAIRGLMNEPGLLGSPKREDRS